MTDALVPPRLAHPDRAVFFAPIRHHSPACALALRAMLREIAPRQVLIEAPADFEALLPVLCDEALKPPVAVVALREGDEDTAVTSYYPLSRHSPETIALQEANRLGAAIAFIDEPSLARLADDKAAPTPPTEPRALTAELPFTTSDYVAALCARVGARDHNELWDHLFESRLGSADWRTFFGDVAAFCTAVRATIAAPALAADRTLAREAHMAARLADALGREAPIVVVTGGLHTPALVRSLGAPPPAAGPSRRDAGKVYVVRYGFRELDRLNGYAAGLPLPAYYDRLFARAERETAGAALAWRDVAADLLTEFAAHLRAERPALTPSLPALANALETAVRLADLRGRPGPLRTDLLDAVLSTCVQGEAVPGAAPILDELVFFLRCAALGDVPASAGSPPLVEHVRKAAGALGFELGFGAPKRRQLDVYRRAADLARSRFLHAMTLLGTGFATRLSGPNPLGGVDADLLFETWTTAWSPAVEARLIELARYGDTLEAATLAEMRRLMKAQHAGTASRDAAAAVALLARACLAGLQPHVATLIADVDQAIGDDPRLETVSRALADLLLVWQAREFLGLVGRPEVEHLIGTAYRRALGLCAALGAVKEERQGAVLAALVTLRQVVVSARGVTAAVDAALFTDLLAQALAAPLPPLLMGAIAAMAFHAGLLDAEALATRISGQLAGGFVDPKDDVAAVRGLAEVAPELLVRLPQLVDDLGDVVASMADEAFIAALPHLRLAFAMLDPRETDAVAAQLASRHGIAATTLAPPRLGVSEADLLHALDLDRRLAASLAADGLGHWLDPEAEA